MTNCYFLCADPGKGSCAVIDRARLEDCAKSTKAGDTQYFLTHGHLTISWVRTPQKILSKAKTLIHSSTLIC